MTARELIEALSDPFVDPDGPVFFSTGIDDRFYSPCPAETGPFEIEEGIPYVNGQGDLVTDKIPWNKAFLLLPHNINNPHD